MDVTPLLGSATGVAGSVRPLFEALSERRDIELSAFAMSARGYRDLDTILPASMKRNRLPMPAGVLQKLWNYQAHPGIERWLGSVDVVHGTNFVVPPSKGAALVTVHDLTSVRFPEMCEPHTLTYPAAIKTAVSRGAHVHTHSQFVADEVHALLGVDRSVIHVVPASLAPRHSAAKLQDPQPRGKYVLALGTVEPRKNYPVLIRAFDSIAAKHKEVKLLIAGGRGWAFNEMQEAITDATNQKQIQYLGRVSNNERTELLINAVGLAYPSIYEGFGLPPLEAMQMGIPVLAASAGALPEVLGDAALFADPHDESSIAEGLLTLIEDDKKCAQLIAAGTKRVAVFDPRRAADQMVDLYKALVQ